MERRYLVLSEDGALDVPPVYVIAETSEEALKIYCRKIQSKEDIYRDYVEGQSLDDFLPKLLFSREQIAAVHENEGLDKPPIDVIRSKVLEYFGLAPELGEQYMRFVEEHDPSILSEAVYEFISERDVRGYDAIEDSTIQTVSK